MSETGWMLLTGGLSSLVLLMGAGLWTLRGQLTSTQDLLTNQKNLQEGTDRRATHLDLQLAELKTQLSDADREMRTIEARELRLGRSLDELRATHVTTRDHAEKLAADLERQTETVDEQASDLEATRRELAETTMRAEEVRTTNATLRQELATYQKEARLLRRQRRALGLDAPKVHHSPTSPERRPVSRAAVRQLLIDSGGDAAALVDARGLAGFAAGQDQAVARLAQLAAVGTQIQGALEQALGGPFTSASVVDRDRCDHIVRLDPTWWLGVENRREAPLALMRLAHLQIVDVPVAWPPSQTRPDTVLDLQQAADGELDTKLVTWVERWGADGAAVIGPEGEVVGTSPAANPSPVGVVRPTLNTMYRRFARDDRDLASLVILARGELGTSVSLRLVNPEVDAPLVAVWSRAEVPMRALDELTGMLRWHRGPSLQAVS